MHVSVVEIYFHETRNNNLTIFKTIFGADRPFTHRTKGFTLLMHESIYRLTKSSKTHRFIPARGYLRSVDVRQYLKYTLQSSFIQKSITDWHANNK